MNFVSFSWQVPSNTHEQAYTWLLHTQLQPKSYYIDHYLFIKAALAQVTNSTLKRLTFYVLTTFAFNNNYE